MGKYFGTDGFRGEAGAGLTAEHAFSIGKYLGWYYGTKLGKRCRCVIGKDTRVSGYMLENALVAGLTSSGADVYLMHVTTTPSVSYIAGGEDFDLGIMISASHNSYYDNGIKLINGNGEKMEEAVILELEKYIDGDAETIKPATGENIGRAFDYTEGRNKYIEHLKAVVDYDFSGVKVGLDCANGASYAIAESIFTSLGATTTAINTTPNGININNNAGSTHIEVIQKLVKEKGLDVGFAYDGDADRCLAVDENGNVVDGDAIMFILGNYFKEKGELAGDVVVTTVMSNLGLYKAFDAAGIKTVKTDVGDKYVYEEMKKSGYIIGGEQSGHIILSRLANTGDGILTSLMLMEVILAKKTKMSELTRGLKIYPQLLKNIRVVDKDEAMKSQVLLDKVSEVEKEFGGDGRVLVRKSGTEPLVRIMVEAASDELCEKYVSEIEAVMVKAGLCR